MQISLKWSRMPLIFKSCQIPIKTSKNTKMKKCYKNLCMQKVSSWNFKTINLNLLNQSKNWVNKIESCPTWFKICKKKGITSISPMTKSSRKLLKEISEFKKNFSKQSLESVNNTCNSLPSLRRFRLKNKLCKRKWRQTKNCRTAKTKPTTEYYSKWKPPLVEFFRKIRSS